VKNPTYMNYVSLVLLALIEIESLCKFLPKIPRIKYISFFAGEDLEKDRVDRSQKAFLTSHSLADITVDGHDGFAHESESGFFAFRNQTSGASR